MVETKAAIVYLSDIRLNLVNYNHLYMQRCILIKLFPSDLELLKDSPRTIHKIDLWSLIHADQKLTNAVQNRNLESDLT